MTMPTMSNSRCAFENMSLPRIVVTGVNGCEEIEIDADEELTVEPNDAGDATIAGISAIERRNEKSLSQ